MIHQYLFDEIYDFAGKLRKVNISKGNFRFAPLMYLEVALQSIDKMPQFKLLMKLVEKYVEMNVLIRSEREMGEVREYGLTDVEKRNRLCG